jgi:FAD/FMN-containing dehydrogenase
LKQWKAAHPDLDDACTPKLSVCGGRHSSRTFVDNAVVLDLSRMKQVQVDVENQTVSVQGGVKIQQLMDTLAPYHLSPVTGTHSDTGVIGLTLGGGQGFLSKQFGPAIDQIVSAEVVLADGATHTVHTDMTKNDKPKLAKDVLFNIRGGGGNIGVVTNLTMKVYPIRNLAMMTKVNFVLTQNGAREVLVRFGEWSSQCPDDCTALMILPLRSPVVVAVGVSSNTSIIPQDVSAEEANKKVRPHDVPGFADLDNNRLGSWFRLPSKFKVKDVHTEALEELSKDPPDRYYYTNIFVPAITPEIAAVFSEAQRGIHSKGISGAVLVFNHAGTRTEQVPSDETAFEMRDKKYWLLSQTTWKATGNQEADEQARNKVVEFNRWFRRAMINAGGQKTIHAVTNQEQDFTAETDYGLFTRYANKERLIQTQRALDPDGIFRMNQTVHE